MIKWEYKSAFEIFKDNGRLKKNNKEGIEYQKGKRKNLCRPDKLCCPLQHMLKLRILYLWQNKDTSILILDTHCQLDHYNVIFLKPVQKGSILEFFIVGAFSTFLFETVQFSWVPTPCIPINNQNHMTDFSIFIILHMVYTHDHAKDSSTHFLLSICTKYIFVLQ